MTAAIIHPVPKFRPLVQNDFNRSPHIAGMLFPFSKRDRTTRNRVSGACFCSRVSRVTVMERALESTLRRIFETPEEALTATLIGPKMARRLCLPCSGSGLPPVHDRPNRFSLPDH